MTQPPEFRLANQHPHTRAVAMANNEITKVIDMLRTGPKFMQDPVSARTQAKRDVIAGAPADVQGLLGQGFTQEFVHRLAKLTGQD